MLLYAAWQRAPHVIANELGVGTMLPGPAIGARFGGHPYEFEERDVLFIDEIHRLSRTVVVVLYPAMEDRAVDIVTEKVRGSVGAH